MSTEKTLREILNEGKNLILPGVLSPIEALLAEKAGFEAVYISGAALSTSLGLLDEGKITREKMESLVREIRLVSDIPILADCDTGLASKKEIGTGIGSEETIIKTVKALEAAGADAIQIEDQVPSQKRCGHLDGKEIIPMEDMETNIKAAVAARKSRDFLIAARTDSRAPEGYTASKWRAYGYKNAGADIIFPEALESYEEFRIFKMYFRDIPLIANLAEGGKSPADLTAEKLFSAGYQIILIPATPLRLVLKFYEKIFSEAKQTGSLKNMMEKNGIASRNEMIEFIKSRSKVYKK